MKKIILFCAAVIAATTSFAQIPNAGFEDWTNTSGYNTPTSWDNLNATTNPLSTYTCIKGTPGYAGASYLQLISKTVMGLGVVPGVAVSGVLDVTAAQPKSGFPFTQRPGSLTGAWQYMAYGSDAGHIIVFLSRWNMTTMSRDTIAYTDHTLSGMVMSWASFNIPLTYMSTASPDSAIIVLSASGTTPVANSYLYVDTLQFTGSATGIVNTTAYADMDIIVSPNPALSNTSVAFSGTTGNTATITITDISGKVVYTAQQVEHAGNNTVHVNTNNFTGGLYLVSVSDEQGRAITKLVIQ